jgi:hypothetical protein
MLYKEYSNVAFMRLHFLASQKRCADQFTVIVRNIPHVSSHSTSETVDEFFRRNHPDHYLGQQVPNPHHCLCLIMDLNWNDV